MEFLADKENLIAVLVWAAIGLFFVALLIMTQVQEMRYMKQQKETGSDKKKVLDAMREVMREHFSDYTYAVGFYTKEDRSGRREIHYYYPYILAFTNTELIIFSFLIKGGRLIIRNCMQVDWRETVLSSKERKEGTKIQLYMEGEWMPIFVYKVVKSTGVEKSDKPLGIYQEQEVERLVSLLPQLKSYAAQQRTQYNNVNGGQK